MLLGEGSVGSVIRCFSTQKKNAKTNDTARFQKFRFPALETRNLVAHLAALLRPNDPGVLVFYVKDIVFTVGVSS